MVPENPIRGAARATTGAVVLKFPSSTTPEPRPAGDTYSNDAHGNDKLIASGYPQTPLPAAETALNLLGTIAAPVGAAIAFWNPSQRAAADL
jgi:hypothetical protein